MSRFGQWLGGVWRAAVGPRPAAPAEPAAEPAADRRAIKARYDAAATTDSNYRHWANADGLSARAANSATVRQRLRDRSRYERANNGYAKGLVETLAHDCVGTGPRLQLYLPDRPPEFARKVEREFAKWAADEAVDLADRLRLADEAEIGDGEAFGLFVTDPAIRHPVKLGVQLVEAEQCADVNEPAPSAAAVDGIVFDRLGNPVEYHFLSDHPGEGGGFGNSVVRIPAKYVFHWFRPGRIGQARGIPGITAGLPVFAQLRRFCLATLEAAETAANIAGVMTNTGLPDDGEGVDVATYDRIPLERGALLSLPDGREAKAFEPSQPTANYADFKGENLDEIGRAVHAPSNVTRGNSREYNFSSGRLDYVIYHRSIRIKRRRMQSRILDKLFRTWIAEARLIPGVLPADLPPMTLWEWSWHWDGFESIDPEKDANAAEKLLTLGLTTYAELQAADGKDWQEVAEQRAREMKTFADLGLAYPGGAAPAPAPAPVVEDPAADPAAAEGGE